jgi:transposase
MGKIFCGIDFHKNTSTLCTLNEDGTEFEKVTTIRTEKLAQYLINRKEWVLAIEASGGVNHVATVLREQGHDVKIINPTQFRGIGIGGKKTDERDAKALATVIRMGAAPEVHLRSLHSRKIKSLLVCREEAVNTRVSLGAHIRSTLREYGISFPAGKEEFGDQIRAKIGELEDLRLKQVLTRKTERYFDLLAEEGEIETQLKGLVGENSQLERLMKIPGIGFLGGCALIAVADEINRFASASQFAAYLGLTPRVHASADKRMMGAITRSGSEIARRYLIHGARATLRYEAQADPMLMWAEKTVVRIGKNKGTVALAHRLSRVCFAMMRDQTDYRGRKKKKQMRKAA